MSNESINSLKRQLYLLITLNQLTQKGHKINIAFYNFHEINIFLTKYIQDILRYSKEIYYLTLLCFFFLNKQIPSSSSLYI